MVYRDPDLPLQVRLHAANIAISREAQVSGGLTLRDLVKASLEEDKPPDANQLMLPGPLDPGQGTI